MLAITLRAGLERKSFASRVVAAVKLQARALAYPLLTRSWLDMLNSDNALRELAHAQPRLLHKIYRPYLSCRLDHRQRLAALIAHYRFVLRHDLCAVVAQATRGHVELASFNGKCGALYRIELRAIVPMEREGEMVLQLRCGDALVYSIAFSFLADGHQAAVGVGCLQGPQSGDGLERAREATRDMHGLRPKNLMVRLVQQLGLAYGCAQVLLVSNDNRAVVKQIHKGNVHADYNAFWEEMGAQRRADGDYALPCAPLLAPVMEEIPSKKRSEARKRHEMLSSIIDTVIAQIGAPRAAPAPVPVLALVPPVMVCGMHDDVVLAAA